LPDLAGPEIAGLSIEGELPRLAKSVRPQFGPRALRFDERVVLWNIVVLARFQMVDVNANNAREKVADVLTGLQFVGDTAPVAAREIQITVLAKRETTGVVPAGRPFEDHLLGLRVAAPGALLADLKT